MPAPLKFISVYDFPPGAEPAPLSVNVPRTVAVARICRIYQGPRWPMVETPEFEQPVNGTLNEVIRAVRKEFPSVHLQTADGWQLLNLNFVSAVLVAEDGAHELGLASGAVVRGISPMLLIDLLAGVGPVEQITRGLSVFHVPRAHILGLDNGHFYVRGGHRLPTTEPSSAILQRLTTP